MRAKLVIGKILGAIINFDKINGGQREKSPYN